MAIQYSGSTIINTTFTGATRGDIASNIITQLLAAGWTNVSGTGNDQVLKCAATAIGATGLQIAARIYDPGTGNCARVSLRNLGGSRIGNDHFLLPGAGKTFRVIANKYHFFCMTPGSSATREFVYVGQLIVPTWLTSTTLNAGIAVSGAQSDTDTGFRRNFRNSLNTCWTAFQGAANVTRLVSDSLFNSGLTNGETAAVRISSISSGGNANGFRWADGTLVTCDALVAFGLSNASDEAKYQGQMSDAIVVSGGFVADSLITFDGGTWTAITSNTTGYTNNVDDNDHKATLFIKVG